MDFLNSVMDNDRLTIETAIIWFFLTLSSLTIIFSSILFSSFFYKKKKIKLFTTKKLTLMSSFLAFFLIQAFIFAPFLELPIPFSFDSITTIAIGFILGPLEGILFGWVADSLRVLIHGWGYQFLPSLMYPMIGLIAGMFGLIYKYKKEIPQWKSTVIFQVIILSFLLFIIPLEYGFMNIDWTGKNISENAIKSTAIITFIATLLTIVFMEITFFIFIRNDKSESEMFLLLLLACVAYMDRMMELSIRPFTQFFSGYEPYLYALYTRLMSSTYLIPTVTITSFILIKTSLFVLELK